MRVSLLCAGLVLLLAHVCVSPARATIDVSIGTPSPTLSPASLNPGDSLTVSGIRVVNSGSSNITTNFGVGVYLVSGSSYTLLGAHTVVASLLNPFRAGTTRTISIPVQIPFGTAEGTRTIGVLLDNGLVLTETNETNNTWTGTVHVAGGIDLVFSAVPTVLSSTTTSPGQTVQLSSFTVTNNGGEAAPATVIGYIFDNCFSPPCLLPWPTQWEGIPALAAGANYVHPPVTVQIPRDENMTGSWRIYVLIDASADASETNENNNLWGANLTMVPTLLDNLDGTITDMNTHLMWMKDANYAGTYMTWAQAVKWAADLVYAGYDDWRLPSGRDPGGSVCNSRISGYDCPNTEFASLYFGWGIHWNAMGPFVNVKYRSYWTATAWPTDPSHSMYQDFDDGGQNDYVASTSCYAWAVRRTGTVSVEPSVPAMSRIVGAFPNPAYGRTTIRFELAGAGAGELGIYDLAGRCVQRWPLAGLPPGAHEVTWASATGGGTPAGVYWCRLGTTGGATRILLLR